MLCDFAKALGIVFALVVIVSIVFALDGLALGKNIYRIALFIRSRFEENK